MFLGVDIGGTFTDLVMLDENGGLVTTKALSTPGELEVGVFNAVEDAARQRGMTGEELLARVVAFGHGTTQATNAVIERDGARTGLIATRGFGDTLAIQRLMGFTAGVPADRLGWYSRRRYPEPIVPRHLVREVRERLDHAGTVLVALDALPAGTRTERAQVLRSLGDLDLAGGDATSALARYRAMEEALAGSGVLDFGEYSGRTACALLALDQTGPAYALRDHALALAATAGPASPIQDDLRNLPRRCTPAAVRAGLATFAF